MNLKDKRVLVFGTGISGIGSAQLLSDMGAGIILYDGNKKLQVGDVMSKLPAGVQAHVIIGDLPDEVIREADLVVLSPGVPTDIEPVMRLKQAGLPVWGEIELAYQCSKGDVLAITGTNGKTTTTTLVGEIMKYHAEKGSEPKPDKVFVVGNIGTPYTQTALETTDRSVSVAEVSSFQLETIDSFHPKVAAVTNITPDHLNRHHTMEEYIRVKERICENQTEDDTLVLNYEDEVLRAFGETVRSRVIYFSSARKLSRGIYLDNGVIELAEDGICIPVLPVKELKLPGLHNYENVMTAVAMTYSYGVPMEEIRHVLRLFTAVEHRIEYVDEKQGVIYYNDSKGTNPDAAIKAVEAMDRPTILIGGGYDKGSSYEDWIRSFQGRVKLLVLIGQTKHDIARQAESLGFTNYVLADTFEEAFAICVRQAQAGDAVLLSPACASWDMFPNYETRGRIFKDLVRKLPG